MPFSMKNFSIALSIFIAVALVETFLWAGMAGPAFGNHRPLGCDSFGCLSPLVWPAYLSPLFGWISYVPDAIFQSIDMIGSYWAKIIIGVAVKYIIISILVAISFFVVLLFWKKVSTLESYLRIKKIFFGAYIITLVLTILILTQGSVEKMSGISGARATANICAGDLECKKVLDQSKVRNAPQKIGYETGLDFPWIQPYQFVENNKDLLSIETKKRYCDGAADLEHAVRCKDNLGILDLNTLSREECSLAYGSNPYWRNNIPPSCVKQPSPSSTSLLNLNKFYSSLKTSGMSTDRTSPPSQYRPDIRNPDTSRTYGGVITSFNFDVANYHFEIIQGEPENVKRLMSPMGFVFVPGTENPVDDDALFQIKWKNEEVISGTNVSLTNFGSAGVSYTSGKEEWYRSYQATLPLNDSLVVVQMRVLFAPGQEYSGVERDLENKLKIVLRSLIQSQK